ncbi:unnamed protein product, partial [Scytosiphon promiscuus]
MLRARDLGVSLVALTAAFLALQGTPDVDIQLRWMVGERPLSTDGANLPVPTPLVTDLDGDGKNEVVLLADGGMTVRVLSIPPASGETLVEPVTLYEAKLAPSSRLPGERRAVAMASGYLEPPPVDATTDNTNVRRLSASTSPGQQQRLVVVREDGSVVCFDHELKRLWKVHLLDHHPSLGKNLGRTYVIDQVAITVTHSVRKLDDRGVPKGGAAEGVVVVGASMRHRDRNFHHNRAGQDQDSGKSGTAADVLDDPLGVHVEAFVEGEEDSRDSAEEVRLVGGRCLFLFPIALRGGDQMRSKEAFLRCVSGEVFFFGVQDLLRKIGTRRSFNGRSDVELQDCNCRVTAGVFLAFSVFCRVAVAVAVEVVAVDGVLVVRCSSLHRTRCSCRLVVLARTREGLEAVELSTGRPLSAVALPAAGSGAGVYADLNGDGVVDHVQAVGTRGDQGWGHLHSGVAMGHLSDQASPSQAQQASRLPPCYALAVSGLPAREQLFNGSLCHDAGALMDIQERLSKQSSRNSPRSRDVEVGAASPAVFRRGPPGVAAAAAASEAAAGARPHGMTGSAEAGNAARTVAGRGGRSDVVFAVSSGVVSSYDDEGRLLWQDRRGPKWPINGREQREGDDGAGTMGGYVIPLALEVDTRGRRGGGGGEKGTPHGEEERILVVGKDKMCIYSRRGRLMGSTPLISGPSQRPVVGDFDGDGMADVLIVGRSGAASGYALSPDPGVRMLFVAVLALAAAMLLVAAVHVPPPPSASLLSSSRG